MVPDDGGSSTITSLPDRAMTHPPHDVDGPQPNALLAVTEVELSQLVFAVPILIVWLNGTIDTYRLLLCPAALVKRVWMKLVRPFLKLVKSSP